MGDMEHITLWDYGRLDDIDEVAQRFQPENLVLFDIKKCSSHRYKGEPIIR